MVTICVKCKKKRSWRSIKSSQVSKCWDVYGLCSQCASCNDVYRDKTCKSYNKSTESHFRIKREKRFKPVLHIGLRLRGGKFAEWANDYCKENL